MRDDLERLAGDAGRALSRAAPVIEATADAARRVLDAAADAVDRPAPRAPSDGRARAVGVNHVAVEVGDVDEALAFYGSIFSFELRGRAGEHMAFVDLGDQFLALSAPRAAPPDDERHFGLVVDDLDAVRRRLEELGIPLAGGRGVDFRDPWGNRVEVVQYDAVQFTKAPRVLRGMGLGGLGKSRVAEEELRAKGLG